VGIWHRPDREKAKSPAVPKKLAIVNHFWMLMVNLRFMIEKGSQRIACAILTR
jgi:hypothetical protein